MKRFAYRICCVAIACIAAMPAVAQVVGGDMVVTLVGTGGPEITADRAGISTLVEADGQKLLFDVGWGALDGLYKSHVLPQTVTHVFLTHLHSDHIAGLPELWMTPWFLLGRTAKLEVWGPVGTQAMVDGMRLMYAHDVEHRANAKFKREDLDVVVHEIQAGVVYAQGDVTVSAVSVEHADGNPAFGYRVQAGKHAVFLTGDCTYGAELVTAAKGVDVVVSNVVAGTPELETSAQWKPVMAKLMLPEQAAMLFEAVKPGLAVYSHFVKKGLPGAAGDAVIVKRTRDAGYKGPLLMGEDHTRIVVGKVVEVERVMGLLPELDGPESRF
jgi:ribonuclease Z